MSRRPTRAIRRILATVLAVGLLVLTACSQRAGGGSGPAAQNPDVLTIAIGSAPASLDPALGSNGDPGVIIFELAYDPLIYRMPDGSYGPGLATSWKYTDSSNTTFEMTLREGVKFSDGSDLTAQGVKDSLEYYGRANGPFASRLQQFESIDVTGPLSLRIRLKTPNPDLPYLLMQRSTTGDIISPKALADPASLGTTTAGAGQYMIDPAQTVTGQTYTYMPNPNYWDKAAVHWDKVVVKVIADPNASLAALQSGQVDYTFGNSRTADSAKAAGFHVLNERYVFTQVQILDRGGQLVPALADQRVRQALNHAIDRKAVTTALFGAYGGPNSQSSLPGSDSYSADLEDYYPYDPERAKQLLAEAGYAQGLTIPMTAFNLQPGQTEAAEAIAAQWRAVGVDVKITVPTSLAELVQLLPTSPTLMFFYGVNPMYIMGSEWFGNGYANPHHVDDPMILDLYARASAEPDPAKRSALWIEVQKRMLDLAWMVPFGAQDKILLVRPGLQGIDLTPTNLDPNPVFFTAAGAGAK